ncbi:hypothetical protein FQA39_LY11759 [Lamprigera yunnana]|nr:hypothetical protein FQA39_LY11759 [Lamprigera yunnana]
MGRNYGEEHPVKPIIELEEAAATRIGQENDAIRMRLKEETVLEKMGLTSLQFPDPQEKEPDRKQTKWHRFGANNNLKEEHVNIFTR